MTVFESNIRHLYKDRGQQWLDSLPDLIDKARQALGLTELSPIPHLTFNYVLGGFRGLQPVILKLGLNEEGFRGEASLLRLMAPYGAAKVIHHDKGYLLLERAVPGTSLKYVKGLTPQDKTLIACRVMTKLLQTPLPPSHTIDHIKIAHLRDWLSILDQSWTIPEIYLRKARKLRDDLLNKPYQDVLLHGDLHHDNILQHRSDWIVIDPKGVVGPAIAETWAFVMNVEQDTTLIAEFFHWNPQEVRDWYFIQVMRALCWCHKDNLDGTLFKNLVEKSYPMTSGVS